MPLWCRKKEKERERKKRLTDGFHLSGDHLNVFINVNWELLFDELKPAFEEALTIIWTDIVDKVFAKVPYNDIFPI